ncbi:MAG: carboxypeptidase-like regulatory domain-containing protein, partial [Algoriphagus sp.]|nr:carboxypeptidase-like regulatory domain-containing protein [Algoriphagus sp.]
MSFIFFSSWGQKRTLSGTVKDSKSGEVLIGANVYDKSAQKGAVTNNYGFFSYTTTESKVSLV